MIRKSVLFCTKILKLKLLNICFIQIALFSIIQLPQKELCTVFELRFYYGFLIISGNGTKNRKQKKENLFRLIDNVDNSRKTLGNRQEEKEVTTGLKPVVEPQKNTFFSLPFFS